MALWLVRTGKYGELESTFLTEDRVSIGFDFEENLSLLKSREALVERLEEHHPFDSTQRRANTAGQLWAFGRSMQPGDRVIVPLKTKRAFAVGEVAGGYMFILDSPDGHAHSRDVKWIAQDIPRTAFDQDLLYSLGAIMTICQIRRNDAERRIKELVDSWGSPTPVPPPREVEDEEAEDLSLDLEAAASDEIERLLIEKFPRGAMEQLVKALLEAQGYTVYHSPTGPDGGVDLLAAPGPLGFGSPRLCVQVKAGNAPIGAPVLRDLGGTMHNVQAEQGLLVSWGGFSSEVERQRGQQFFNIRLWDRADLIQELLDNYEALDSTLKAEIPLKQIWAVVRESD